MRDLKAIYCHYSLRIGSGPGRSENCHSCQIMSTDKEKRRRVCCTAQFRYSSLFACRRSDPNRLRNTQQCYSSAQLEMQLYAKKSNVFSFSDILFDIMFNMCLIKIPSSSSQQIGQKEMEIKKIEALERRKINVNLRISIIINQL